MKKHNKTKYKFSVPQDKDSMEYLKNKIRTIPDFPKPGILFRDITTLLADPKAFNLLLICL